MADKQPMTEKDLLALIGQLEKSALGSPTAAGPSVAGQINPAGQQMTTLEVDRYNALNAYYARPLGNEIPDRSAVVFPELRDTVEWIVPQLMRMFVAGRPVQFDATGAMDEQQADIESETISQIFLRDNNGFFVMHDMIKDALLLRNGYANIYWKREEKSTVESYTDLDENALTQIMTPDSDPDDEEEIEVLEQEERQPDPAAVQIAQMMGAASPSSVFDIKIRRTRKEGRICVECAPPEEMLVSAQATGVSIDDVQFVEHKTEMPRGELLEMGFDREKVESISQANPTWLNLIKLARDEVVDQLAEDGMESSDRASQLISLRTVYIRCDYDGDGLPELRRVMIGGEQILENEECEEQSFAACVSMRMPHRHTGISMYDILFDLQVIKTTLWRQGLDNTYINNNQRWAIDASKVNVADMLIARPGGLVRTQGSPGESMMPMVSPTNVMEQIMPALDYCDQQRTMRTGVGKDTMGLDADVLQDVTKGGQLAAMSAASLKVELVARLLAEGFKDMFLKMHRLLIRNQKKSITMKIAGQWRDIDPSTWKDRSSVTVNVGLGSGTNEERRQNLMMLSQAQDKLAMAIGSPMYPKVWEQFRLLCATMGFNAPEKFGMDPHTPEYQQAAQQKNSQPNPEMMKIQAQSQAHQQDAQQDAQNAQQQAQMEVWKANQVQQAQAKQADQQIMLEQRRDAADRESDMVQTLIKAFAGIIASQYKQDPAVNAGQVMTQDVQTAQAGGI